MVMLPQYALDVALSVEAFAFQFDIGQQFLLAVYLERLARGMEKVAQQFVGQQAFTVHRRDVGLCHLCCLDVRLVYHVQRIGYLFVAGGEDVLFFHGSFVEIGG